MFYSPGLILRCDGLARRRGLFGVILGFTPVSSIHFELSRAGFALAYACVDHLDQHAHALTEGIMDVFFVG